MTFDGKAFGVEIVGAVKAHIEQSVAPLLLQIETLTTDVARLKAVPQIVPLPREAVAELVVEMIAPEIADLQKQIADIPPAPELPDIPAMILESVLPLTESIVAVDVGYKQAIAALPPAENGKDADPELVASLVKETVERAVAALPMARDGNSVSIDDVRPLIDEAVTKAITLIPVPRDGQDGRNAVDLADLLVVEGGDVVATFTDGRTKILGPFRGKDGEPGKDGKDIDLAEIDRLIAEKVAKIQAPPEFERDAYLAAFAPDDVAANISLAVKMMAETPQTMQMQQRLDAQPINVSVTMPEMKASDTTVNVSLPEQQPPTVTIEPSVVNVAPANVHVETRRGKEVTRVTGWDEKTGRITSFEKTEEE